MQRGVKLATVTVVLASGICTAMLFRKHPASPDAEPRLVESPLARREPDGGVSAKDVEKAAAVVKVSPAHRQGAIPRSTVADGPGRASLAAPLQEIRPAMPERLVDALPDGDIPPPPEFAENYGGGRPGTVVAPRPLADGSGRIQEIGDLASVAPRTVPTVGVLPTRTHRVVDGDTLTKLAARYWNQPERYRELFLVNRDVLQSPDLLPIGATLVIPAADAPPPVVPTLPEEPNALVPLGPATPAAPVSTSSSSPLVPLDPPPVAMPSTASSPSPTASPTTPFGAWPLPPSPSPSPLAAPGLSTRSAPTTAPGLSTGQPSGGFVARPLPNGQLLTSSLPSSLASTTAPNMPLPTSARLPSSTVRTYTVQPGDRLPDIAQRMLGDASRMGEIIQANAAQLRQPEDFRAGMTLVIP